MSMMFHISKIDDYLKIWTDDELKDFRATSSCEYLKSMKEKLYSKLNEERNLGKVVESVYISSNTY